MVIAKDSSTEDYKALLLNRLEVSAQQWNIKQETVEEEDSKRHPSSPPNDNSLHEQKHHHHHPHQFLQDPHARAQDIIAYLKLLVQLEWTPSEKETVEHSILDKLLRIPQVYPTAKAVQSYWSSQTPSLLASTILQEFDERQYLIQHIQQRAKPDMIAFKELRHDPLCGQMIQNAGHSRSAKQEINPNDPQSNQQSQSQDQSPQSPFGLVPGIPLGFHFRNRGQAAITGVHTKILRGIDYPTPMNNNRTANKEIVACTAVCMSDAGYTDEDHEILLVQQQDNDNNDAANANRHPHNASSTTVEQQQQQQPPAHIWYMGEGKVRKNQLVEDQKESPGNRALLHSVQTQQPIRMIRKGILKKQQGNRRQNEIYYEYQGLYRCQEWTYQPVRPGGPKAYRFQLLPVMELNEHGEYQSWFAVLRALEMI